MKLVSTFHPPSSVVASVRCYLRADSEYGHLVVAKTNRIEAFNISRGGLQQECDLEIWGRVLAIQVIPGAARIKHRDSILIMTDHPDPRIIVLILEQTNGVNRLVTVGGVSLHDRIPRHAEFCNDVVVDPSGSIAVVSCYVGKLKVLTFKEGRIEREFDVTLPELNLLSLTLLPVSQDQYSLAIVHMDFQQRMQLICRELHIDTQELSSEVSQVLPSTMLSPAIFPFVDLPPILIPVPSFSLVHSNHDDIDDDECLGGVLVVGGRKIVFYELGNPEGQSTRRGKKRRLEKRKASLTESEFEKAKEKEKERGSRKLKPKCHVRWPWSEVTAWNLVDLDSRKFLLGDKFGRISLLVLDSRPRLVLLPVGETSPPTSITYLTNQVMYVGSHLGPSQLVRVHQEVIGGPEDDTLFIPPGISASKSIPAQDQDADTGEGEDLIDNRKTTGFVLKSKGQHVEILDSYYNIAPVMDAVLADVEFSGQVQVITCSGGANSGSLNAIRSGAEVKELAVIEGLSCITAIFPIRSRFEQSTHSHLLVSTSYDSYVLRLDDQEVFTILDSTGSPFITDTATLAMANISRRVASTTGGRTISTYVDSAYVVQVTAKGIRLLEFDEDSGIFHVVGDGWSPDNLDSTWRGREIVAASVNASQFVLALSGGRLALFNIADDQSINLVKFQDFLDGNGNGREICAVSCAPFDRTKHFALYIAASFWDSNTVTVLSLEKVERYMAPLCSSTELPALPRSVLLHNFGSGNRSKDQDYQPCVVAGLTDGSAVSFTFKNNLLSDKKVVSLGAAPVTLSPCQVEGRHAIFASGSRAAILHWDRKRLRQSSVMLKDVVTGITINTSSFPSALVAATTNSLILSQIGGIDKMQVRSVNLGLDNPTRIAFDPISNLFGIACLRSTPTRIGDAEIMQSSFNVFNSSFRGLGQFLCEADEEVTSVASSSSLSVPLAGRLHSCFVVGTVRHQIGKSEPNLGRLMIFTSEGLNHKPLRPLIGVETDGCVYAIAILDNLVVAAVNTAVLLYRIVSEDADGLALKRLCQWNHNYFVTSLMARNGTIVAGDAISSVTVLHVQDSELKTIARDYGPVWPVAVEMTPGGGVIGADCDCNLFSFSQARSGARTILERDGAYHLGEVVNKLLPGGVTARDSGENDQFQADHLFFTSSGRVGLIVQVADDIALPLTALQRNMAKMLHGPGDVSHTKTRAPTTSRGTTDAESAAFGFLDGDFLEQYLTEPRQLQLLHGELDVERVPLDQAEVEALLEKLQSLH